MNPEQALEFLDAIVLQVNMNRQMHAQAIEARRVIAQALSSGDEVARPVSGPRIER